MDSQPLPRPSSHMQQSDPALPTDPNTVEHHENMLPPFRISNLRSTSGTPSPQTHICIAAPKYDIAISSHSDATLKYVDEDGGDLITVGSSLELAQRLGENPTATKFIGRPMQPSSECHTFNIHDREQVQNLWRGLQRESYEKTGPEAYQVLSDPRVAVKPTPLAREMSARSTEDTKIQGRDLGVGSREDADPPGPWFWPANQHYPPSLNIKPSQDSTSQALERRVDMQGLYDLEKDKIDYFQNSMPPRLRPLEVTGSGPSANSKDDEGFASPVSTTPYPISNLTIEGRRQAQAAGHKLRARSGASRYKKSTMSSTDEVDLQNRWASYQSSTSSAFVPQKSTTRQVAPGASSLTLEGKRQAQVAGEKLRSRTNPIRHSRPDRITPEKKRANRWSSYDGARVTRFGEKLPEDSNVEPAKQDSKKPSLLDVFEAELAKSSNVETFKPHSKQPSSSDVFEADSGKTSAKVGGQKAEHKPSAQVDSSSNAVTVACSKEPPVGNSGDQAPCKHDSDEIEKGISTAVQGFEICIRGIVDCLKAAGAREGTHIQVLDHTKLAFENLVGQIAAVDKATPPRKAHELERPKSGVPDSKTAFVQGAIAPLNCNRAKRLKSPFNEAVAEGSNAPFVYHNADSSLPRVARVVSDVAFRGSPQLPKSTVQGTSEEPPLPFGYVDLDVTSKLPKRTMDLPPLLEQQQAQAQQPARAKQQQQAAMQQCFQQNAEQSTQKHQQQQQVLTSKLNRLKPGRTSAPPPLTLPTINMAPKKNFEPAATFNSIPLPRVEPLIPMPLADTKNTRNAHIEDSEDLELSAASNCPKLPNMEPLLPTFSKRTSSSHPNIAPMPEDHMGEDSDRLYGHHHLHPIPISFATHLSDSVMDPTMSNSDYQLPRPSTEPRISGNQVPFSNLSMENVWSPFYRDTGRSASFEQRTRLAQMTYPTQSNRRSETIPRRPRAERQRPRSYEHQEATSAGRIQKCVENLKELGFEGIDEHRLLVYSQAARGEIGEALDLLDEDERAHNERSQV